MAMSNNFNDLLAGNKTPAASSNKAGDKPKAQVWGNIGYLATVKNDESGEEERRFVSVASGIALDNIAPLATNGKKSWANFQSARNNLTKKLVELGMGLDPGSAAYFPQDAQDGQLIIEIRRVGEENTADDEASNPYIFDL